ncbi:MAG: TrkA family potassium uptake protein [Ruminococcus sp.]|nr:TrkA family potassium uptake protein [Ruminococcus sp.]
MKSVLVIGLGRFGRHLCKGLTEAGNEVLAIDSDEVRCNHAVNYATEIQIADATDPAVIESLGVKNFDFCVVAIADNFQSSLETTSLLADNGANYILARANSDVHEKFLLRNGANEVVYAERDMGERIAVRFGNNRVIDYIKLNNDYSIYEIKVPEKWIGKTILKMDVRAKYKINIISIRNGEEQFPLPDPRREFEAEDVIMIMGHKEDIAPLVK